MAEKQPLPKIEHSYSLRDGDEGAGSIFQLAGSRYAQTRAKEEATNVNFEYQPHATLVTYGRKVLQILNQHDFELEATTMQNDIEELISSFGYGEIAARSYAGRKLSGPLPEQE
jgi:hypothetical protein